MLQAKEEFSKAVDNVRLTDGHKVLQHDIRSDTSTSEILEALQANFTDPDDQVDEDATSRICFFCPTRHKQILFSTSRESLYDPGTVYKSDYANCKGVSPTVHVGWFIAQAYLANLLYTAERDYAATVETCDKILDTNKLSDQNRHFSERTIPVVISTEWSEIFDGGIQTVIGFLFSLFVHREQEQSDARVYL